jgi:hypothetical protein
MSRDRAFRAADHDRARDLAATRVDDVLSPADEAWLAEHLEACGACAAVAADFDAQHDLFDPMRAFAPEPPRDLWARTSAAIEAEHRRRSGVGQWRRRLAAPTRTRLSLAPLAAVLAVAVIVGASLLNATLTPGGAAATPIPMAAADVQVISRDPAGNVRLLSRPLDQVCPVDASDCGPSPTFAVTAVGDLDSGSTLQGAISPTGGQLVVVTRDGNGEGVWVFPVRETTAPAPSASASPAGAATAAVATASGRPSPSRPAGTSAAATGSGAAPSSATPAVSGAATGSAHASPSAVASAPSTASPSPASASPSTASGSPAPATAGATAAAPSASTAASPPAASSPAESVPLPATAQATVQPSIEVTPAPEAAVKIASGVRVVGAPAYSPDGDRLAFSAMPSDGSTGPDVYVWAVGDKFAQAITSDHGSWLAAWTGDGIIASRVADGMPSTVELDPVTGHAVPIGPSNAWLPAVSADGSTAAWWAGTVKLGADGTWAPDSGKLVLGGWPDASGGGGPQVIAKGPIDAWQVRWDEKGTAVAMWVGSPGHDGKLSLYRVDGATGVPDLANPMLDATAATADFSLRSGRLVWTDPSTPDVLQVLAWSGKTTGRLQVPADGSGTVVP